jgi:hypothetical protein
MYDNALPPAPSERCPGCWREKPPRDICCDPCWARLPAKLPVGPGGELQAWRRRNAQLRRYTRTNDYVWQELGRIMDAARAWLVEHPERVSVPGVRLA